MQPVRQGSKLVRRAWLWFSVISNITYWGNHRLCSGWRSYSRGVSNRWARLTECQRGRPWSTCEQSNQTRAPADDMTTSFTHSARNIQSSSTITKVHLFTVSIILFWYIYLWKLHFLLFVHYKLVILGSVRKNQVLLKFPLIFLFVCSPNLSLPSV